MARKKVILQPIANDATRRATFKKRLKGLMKKARELATLCDVKACVVVYGEGEGQPEVWPSFVEAAPTLARFKAMPELDQCKKMMNQEGFLRQHIAKLQEQLHKWERETRERETMAVLLDAMLGRRPGLAGLTIEELVSLGWMVEMRLKNVNSRIEQLHGQALAMHASYAANSPPRQEGWHMVKSDGDLDALVYGGFSGADSAGASTASDMTRLSNVSVGFSWADPAPSFPPFAHM